MSKSLIYKMGVLLLLVMVVAIFEYFDEDPLTIDSKHKNNATIDYFADDINVVQYKPDGTIDYDTSSKKLTHLQEKDISYLVSPTALLYKNQTNPWQIVSDKGEVGPKGDTVILINNVKGTQTDEKGGINSFEIGKQISETDPVKYGQVKIYPDKKYAESNDYIIFNAPDGQTSGTGVKANMDTNQIQVLSNVKTKINRGQNAN